MNKKNNLWAFILILILLFNCAGCDLVSGTPTNKEEPIDPPVIDPVVDDKVIVVKSTMQVLDVKDLQVENIDYLSLFTITVDDEEVPVKASYIDALAVKSTPGVYKVTCTYENKVAFIYINVLETIYSIECEITTIDIPLRLYDEFDLKEYFIPKLDDQSVSVTDAMVTTNLKKEVGTYTYSVKHGNVTKSITVNVVDTHDVLIIPSYTQKEVYESEANDFDFTTLFSLFVDGMVVEVKENMLNIEALELGKTSNVSLSYTVGDTTEQKTTKVLVVSDPIIKIDALNIETYPNSKFIDLTSLFTIKKGDELINVTSDMISGEVNYSTPGVYPITLNYNGLTKVANVSIISGVIITAKSSNIMVAKGTNISEYDFAKDVTVIINGVKFKNIASYIDTTSLDFDTLGSYQAIVNIPYNGETITKAISYEVVKNKYEINVKQDIVTLKATNKNYNVFDNLEVYINDRKQTLTTNAEFIDLISCYAKVTSDGIDYNSIGMQEITVAVYPNGPEDEAISITYQLIIESSLQINAYGGFAFLGDTVNPLELFEIKNGNEVIPVTFDMISGKVDTFKPGTYDITLNFMGITSVARFVVIDTELVGTYKTKLSTIATQSTGTDAEGYEEEATSTKPLGDLIIGLDGSVILNGTACKILQGINENTITIQYYSNILTLHYNNGIITIDPDNSIRLSFSDYKRPLTYFKENVWTIEKHVVLNYGSEYVLSTNLPTYSIDLFKINDGTTTKWFAQYVNLAEKSSVDYIYVVEFGECTFNEEISFVKDTKSSLTFNGKTYNFVVVDSKTLKVDTQSGHEMKYANMVFDGMVDGKAANLFVSQYEGFSLANTDKQYFDISASDVRGLVNGGIDYDNDIVFVYDTGRISGTVYAYKFQLDLTNMSFEIIEKTSIYGKFEIDGMYIFLDGYGSGLISFDTTSYYTTAFDVTQTGNELTLTYKDTSPTFKYGSYASLYIDELQNSLTPKYFCNIELNDIVFYNTQIFDGGIIHINSYELAANSNAVLAKKSLVMNMQIITKDGELSDKDKLNCLDVTNIDFSQPGFYYFTITLTVGDYNIVMPFALQII